MSISKYFLLPTALGKGPTISKPHGAKSQGLDRGLRTPPGWCMLGANLWHWSHFFTYYCALFTCSATDSLAWELYKIEIYHLCDSRKFPHAIPQKAALMFQDECTVGTVQRRSACTVSDPRIARIGAPFAVFSQLLVYPMAEYLLLRMILWDPSN